MAVRERVLITDEKTDRKAVTIREKRKIEGIAVAVVAIIKEKRKIEVVTIKERRKIEVVIFIILAAEEKRKMRGKQKEEDIIVKIIPVKQRGILAVTREETKAIMILSMNGSAEKATIIKVRKLAAAAAKLRQTTMILMHHAAMDNTDTQEEGTTVLLPARIKTPKAVAAILKALMHHAAIDIGKGIILKRRNPPPPL